MAESTSRLLVARKVAPNDIPRCLSRKHDIASAEQRRRPRGRRGFCPPFSSYCFFSRPTGWSWDWNASPSARDNLKCYSALSLYSVSAVAAGVEQSLAGPKRRAEAAEVHLARVAGVVGKWLRVESGERDSVVV